jgi:hypothetical protein
MQIFGILSTSGDDERWAVVFCRRQPQHIGQRSALETLKSLRSGPPSIKKVVQCLFQLCKTHFRKTRIAAQRYLEQVSVP